MKLYRTWLGRFVLKRMAREGVYGVDTFIDIRRRLPHFSWQCMFDVGANSGQSTLAYCQRFPKAEIYSFEPGPKAFAELSHSVASKNRVHAIAKAVGASNGDVGFLAEEDSHL